MGIFAASALLFVQKRSPFLHSSPMLGQQSQLLNDRYVNFTHSVVHVLTSNDTLGNEQLGAKAVVRNAVPEQYFALKPAMSVPAALAAQVYSGIGQQSQSVFLFSQFPLHIVLQVGATAVYLCGQLGAILSLKSLDDASQ